MARANATCLATTELVSPSSFSEVQNLGLIHLGHWLTLGPILSTSRGFTHTFCHCDLTIDGCERSNVAMLRCCNVDLALFQISLF